MRLKGSLNEEIETTQVRPRQSLKDSRIDARKRKESGLFPVDAIIST